MILAVAVLEAVPDTLSVAPEMAHGVTVPEAIVTLVMEPIFLLSVIVPENEAHRVASVASDSEE